MSVLLSIGGGIGDAIQGLNYAFELSLVENVSILCFMRDETFEILKYLFKDEFILTQHKDKEKLFENYWVINNQDVLKEEFPDFEKYEFHVPDLLMRKINCFDIPLHPQVIKQTRLLTHKWSPEKIIYVGTNTSTPEYFYNKTPALLKRLSEFLPDYEIYYNNVTSWAGHKLDNGDFSKLPLNISYYENHRFEDSLEFLKRSCYCISVDNGISHIAYSMGIPRTVLSVRLGIDGIMWQARWLEDLNECIPYTYTPTQIAELAKINIKIPQTTLVNRQIILNNPMVDWGKALLFKF